MASVFTTFSALIIRRAWRNEVPVSLVDFILSVQTNRRQSQSYDESVPVSVRPSGRRSRRNSFSEDSQLTIENFGGSQDHLNIISRPVERERKFSNSTVNNHTEPTVAARSSIADARGTLQLGYDIDSESEKQDRETEKTGTMRRHPR